MSVKYAADINCGIQSVMDGSILIYLILNKKNISLANHYVNHIVLPTIMIMTWIKTRDYFSHTFINK